MDMAVFALFSCSDITFCVPRMTSSNGNIFRVTGPLCGQFTGPGEFPTQRPVTRSFDVFFDLRLNKWLSKQHWGWWFETPSWSLWHHCNALFHIHPCPWGSLYCHCTPVIARFMRLIWGPPGADRTQMGPMLASWTLLSGLTTHKSKHTL